MSTLPDVDPHEVVPAVSERRLFEQLDKLRREQIKLRETASSGIADAKRSARLRQIDVESATAWSGIRSARAAARATHRARFAQPPLDPFRGFVPRKPQ
jgi:hypothetical protein